MIPTKESAKELLNAVKKMWPNLLFATHYIVPALVNFLEAVQSHLPTEEELRLAVVDKVKENKFVRCHICNGTGVDGLTQQGDPLACMKCHGSGEVKEKQPNLIEKGDMVYQCPSCRGSGDETSDGQGRCGTCKGTGVVKK